MAIYGHGPPATGVRPWEPGELKLKTAYRGLTPVLNRLTEMTLVIVQLIVGHRAYMYTPGTPGRGTMSP